MTHDKTTMFSYYICLPLFCLFHWPSLSAIFHLPFFPCLSFLLFLPISLSVAFMLFPLSAYACLCLSVSLPPSHSFQYPNPWTPLLNPWPLLRNALLPCGFSSKDRRAFEEGKERKQVIIYSMVFSLFTAEGERDGHYRAHCYEHFTLKQSR